MKALAFGEVLWDVYNDKKTIGGAPLNFAAHLAKHGNSVSLLSSVGRDAEGEEALDIIKSLGISTDHVSVLCDRSTGKCLVTLDENAVPSYNLLEDVAYDRITCKSDLDGFDVLYFGTLSLRSKHNMDRLKEILNLCSFKDVFVDLNVRLPFSTEDAVKFAVEKATMLKVSDEEMPFVANALGLTRADDYRIFAKELSDRFKNLKCIVVTLGARGAYALDVSKNIESSCEADKVALASTVGAGDSFSASFLDQYYKKPLELALKYASKIAGYVVSCYDAVPNYDPNDFL